FDAGNDLPYILYLPTYTAIAWYHKKLPPDLQGGGVEKAIEESRKFAVGEYADALMTGDALPSARRGEIIQKVARLTGLSPDYIDRTNLRIEIQRFTKELLRSERRTIGRIDARFKGIDRDAAGERPEFDPSIAAIIGPYSGMLNDYARNDLKFDSDLPYEVLTGRVRPWNYAPYENRYVNVAETLHGGEPLNATWFVVAAVCCYLVAYRLYSAFVAAKVLALDDTRATPCERHDDGRDFVPTNKWVLFGHHFAAIAGPGPLVGPTLAAQFGYLPGTLWLIAGAAFGGCVQDFVILFCSIRRDGKSLGQMAREEVSERGGFIAQLAVHPPRSLTSSRAI